MFFRFVFSISFNYYVFSCILERNWISGVATKYHDNMSMQRRPPNTPLVYSKTRVYKGIHYFLIFALKHRLRGF